MAAGLCLETISDAVSDHMVGLVLVPGIAMEKLLTLRL